MSTIQVFFCPGNTGTPPPPSAVFHPHCSMLELWRGWDDKRHFGNPAVKMVQVFDPQPNSDWPGQSLNMQDSSYSGLALFFPAWTIWLWHEKPA